MPEDAESKNATGVCSQNFHNCNGFGRRSNLLTKITLSCETSEFLYFPIVTCGTLVQKKAEVGCEALSCKADVLSLCLSFRPFVCLLCLFVGGC